MITMETKVRVRYGETDKMGYVYYGVYSLYFEVGRTELIRQLGISYKQMEDEGILLPVHSLHIRYLRPANYDDLLTIRTTIRELPGVRIVFHYEIVNEREESITTGDATLVFTDALTRRPRKAPENILEKMRPFFA